jgi:hypothetical protein
MFERLDPWLYVGHPGLGEESELLAAEVGLDLVEEVVVGSARHDGRKERREVAPVDDVVHGLETEGAIPARKFCQFVEHPLRRLAPERHGRTVEAAEGAVVASTPPASAGRFERQRDRAVALGLEQPQRLGAVEVLRVVRRRQVVESLRHRRGLRQARTSFVASRHAGDARRVADGGQRVQQAGEGEVALPDDCEVDVRERAEQFEAHLALEVGAAEHRDQVRVSAFEPACQRQGGHGLLEGRGEPHDPGAGPYVQIGELVQVGRDVRITCSQQAIADAAGHALEILEIGGEVLEEAAVDIRCRVAEGRDREQPIAHQPAAHMGERLIEAGAQTSGEVEAGVQGTDRKPVRRTDRAEQTELHGGSPDADERHRDQGYGEICAPRGIRGAGLSDCGRHVRTSSAGLS